MKVLVLDNCLKLHLFLFVFVFRGFLRGIDPSDGLIDSTLQLGEGVAEVVSIRYETVLRWSIRLILS